MGNLRRLNNELTDKIQTYEAQVTLLRRTSGAAEVKEAVEKLRSAGEGVARTIAANRRVIHRSADEASFAELSEDPEDSLQVT